jgi:hypothetical protein
MPLPKILTNIFSSGASDLVKNIGEAIDRNVTNKEEAAMLKLEAEKVAYSHVEEMAKLALQDKQADLADTQQARSTNVQIQESDKASFLSKNVPYFIDMFIFLIWGTMTIYIIGRFLNILKAQQGVDFSGVLGIYSGITAIAMTVLNFHRGTSRGSEDKQKQINEMMKKPQN